MNYRFNYEIDVDICILHIYDSEARQVAKMVTPSSIVIPDVEILATRLAELHSRYQKFTVTYSPTLLNMEN